jgi:hypothetical protein
MILRIDLDQKITDRLLEEASRQKASPELLARVLIMQGLYPQLVKHRDASHLVGTWTDQEVQEFEEFTKSLHEVHEDQLNDSSPV